MVFREVYIWTCSSQIEITFKDNNVYNWLDRNVCNVNQNGKSCASCSIKEGIDVFKWTVMVRERLARMVDTGSQGNGQGCVPCTPKYRVWCGKRRPESRNSRPVLTVPPHGVSDKEPEGDLKKKKKQICEQREKDDRTRDTEFFST